MPAWEAMALVPAGGGGEELARACHFCARPAAGPCAWCRLPVCGAGECSEIVEEPGLAPVVLCRDCAAQRPAAASRPWLAPMLGAVGVVSCAVAWLLGDGPIVWIGSVGGALLVLAGAAAIWSRWQWRGRLQRARGRSRERGSGS